jgi:DMSO/TMAO reductase YedYZ heme-binding membrane subunit
MVKLFEGALREKKFVVKVVGAVFIFWLLQFLYQYISLAAGDGISRAFIRSFAFSSAMLVGLALLSGPVARFFPKLNFVRYRRELGVLGFCLGFMHFFTIFMVVFNFDFSRVLWNTDPFVNALLFGLFAIILLIPAFLTSTDWAMQKLGRKWKQTQSVVYVAWINLVLHFVQINPAILLTPPGILLTAVTVLVFIFQLASFLKYSKKLVNTILGSALILIGVGLFYVEHTATKSDILMRMIEYGFGLVVVGAFAILLYDKFKRKAVMPVTAPAPEPVAEPSQEPVAEPAVEPQTDQ